MPQSKIARLVKRLYEKTDRGELDWEETINENCYKVTFPNYSVQIVQSFGGVGEENYYITIYDEEGKLLESVSDEDLDDREGTLEDNYYYKIMRNMYESARRSVLGTDKALDSILSELEGDDPF